MRVYSSPKVFNAFSMELESSILAGSVIQPSSEIESTGQEVNEVDADDASFNHNWV